MDCEFHYYVNYIVAYAAGFDKQDAFKIAYSSQFVDDNNKFYELDDGYKNQISQSIDLTMRRKKLYNILKTFHFVPGDVPKYSNRRDGGVNIFSTTPDNFKVKFALRRALKSNNLYLIGIASHAYADSWAHQNFTGTFTKFNAIEGFPRKLIPNIGHADAYHWPDKVGVRWHDWRLSNPIVDNNERFLKAAYHLYCEYNSYLGVVPNICRAKLMRNLRSIFGTSKYINRYRILNFPIIGRQMKYRKYILETANFKIPRYSRNLWVNKALKFRVHKCTWQNKNSDWYYFQEAVKEFYNFFPLGNI